MVCYWRELLELLPPWLRLQMDDGGQAREVRLRLGQPPQICTAQGEWYPTGRRISAEDLCFPVNVASRYSAYAAVSLAQGYLTAQGGHRVGICGSAVVQDGRVTGLKELRSVCIRVARDIPGLAAGLEKRLGTGSALLLGPPGSGKTTLLRDLIRQVSQCLQQQISVVDQRGELFPANHHGFSFSPGDRTDVLTGAGKGEGIALVLRSMGPAWIALDEITALEDCAAMEQSSYCGVRFLATVHALDKDDLKRRPVYRRLLQTGMFTTAICLRQDQTFTVERLDDV